MRREPHQSFARRGDDAFLLEFSMNPADRFLYIRWSRSNDRRPDRKGGRDVPADRLQPLSEERRHAHGMFANDIDTDLQREIDRRAHAIDAGGVQRAGLEPARRREELDRAVDEFPLPVDVRPAGLEALQLIAP